MTSNAVIAASPMYAIDQPQWMIISDVSGTNRTIPTPPPAQAMPSAVPRRCGNSREIIAT